MKLVTSAQMQSIDRAAIDGHGIPSVTLMERAGTAVADAAQTIAEGRKGTAIAVCGRGNNGGDGLVAARLLIERGLPIAVFLLGRSTDLSPDARVNWERLAPLTTHIFEIAALDDLKLHHPTIAGSSVIIDAIFGTGLMRSIDGPLAQMVEYLNALRAPVVAVDIPSGLSADTGLALGTAVKAQRTVTFGCPKVGLYAGDAADYVGEITIADIGIPPEEVAKVQSPFALIDRDMLKPLFPPRAPASHKGTYGHVGIVAGSGGKLGAGYLASLAALRAGAGLVTYYLPESSFEKFDARYPEVMCEAIPDRGRKHFHPDGVKQLIGDLASMSAVAVGPALGTHDDTRKFVQQLIGSIAQPMVIDADGLNNLDAGHLTRRSAPTVITPHPGEFSTLTATPIKDIQKERLSMARAFAQQHRVCLVLKGHNTIVATPDGRAYINPTGNPGMASAGMGDALTGAIAGLIAQGIPPDMAAVAGAYLHGLAGDRAAAEIGDRGMVASDVIRRLPQAMSDVCAGGER